MLRLPTTIVESPVNLGIFGTTYSDRVIYGGTFSPWNHQAVNSGARSLGHRGDGLVPSVETLATYQAIKALLNLPGGADSDHRFLPPQVNHIDSTSSAAAPEMIFHDEPYAYAFPSDFSGIS